ncbi:origin recognition complex subunit 6 [Vanessa cardui]|uniref:origin recognition complex subunit 6 n=1 Tax=Vanessa cardui TaxID=171605 RepID=UPI001F131DB2|nr:origin recognition complex subunit 6 [Vanessa cardui]
MATHNRTLKLIATKLGVGEEDKVINKAAEFERLLQTKSIAGSSITDTSKIVICLDLAASIYGSDLDNKAAIKYSGLKGPSYLNCKKVVENLLEINNDKLTVHFLCVSMQCTGVQSLAENILEEYQRQAKTDIDLNLPQYVCMAVYQACRVNKVKISKSKIIERSRLKSAQWTKLDADWTKFVDEKFATVKKRGRPPKAIEKNDDDKLMEVDSQITKEEKQSEPQIEPYEDWKKRMLETAYKELKELEKQRNETEDNDRVRKIKEQLTSPRRSPRKTPQKFSPYKSPVKACNGIRLLFPKEL